MKIILGSESKARKHLLETMGYQFDVLVSNIDEKSIRTDDPYQLPVTLAKAKSEEIQKQLKYPAIIITADSVALHEGQLKEKPESEEQAKEFLRSYGKKPVEVISALYVINTKTGKSVQGLESSKVYFHVIPEGVIEDIVKLGKVMSAAGGFIVEDPAIRKYIVHVEGSMDTVMGLPKMLTKKLIDQVFI